MGLSTLESDLEAIVRNAYDVISDASGPETSRKSTHESTSIRGAVSLQGESAGCLTVTADSAVAFELAAGMFGLGEELTAQEATEAVTEFANILAGNLAGNLAGHLDWVSSPGLPLQNHAGAPDGLRTVASVGLSLDEGSLVVDLLRAE